MQAAREVRIGRYRLLRLLGRGGMATVYHAVQEGPHGFKNEVAIKLVHPELVAAHPHVVEMLVDEARIAARVKHAHVVRMLDLCQDEFGLYLVMEYVDGLSMREVLDAGRVTGRPAPLGPVLEVLHGAALGLDAAHRLARPDGTPMGLVHRDVKPGNILVSKDGEAKVADFGIAMFDDRQSEHTIHGQMKGTPAYMSPEQALGEKVDGRSDVFSLGMTLYTLATSKLAFTGETATAVALKIAQESMDPHAGELDALLPGLGDVLKLACAKKADDRYPTAADMAEDLLRVRSRVSDRTTLAELLAGSGWRAWDPEVSPPEPIVLPGAVAAVGKGSLLSTSSPSAGEDDEPTDSDAVAPVVEPQFDLEATPPAPAVEVLMPGQAPRGRPLPVGQRAPRMGAPPSGSMPRPMPSGSMSPMPSGSMPPMPPISAGPPPGWTPERGRRRKARDAGLRVEHERDYRGRMVRKETAKRTIPPWLERAFVVLVLSALIAATAGVAMMTKKANSEISEVRPPGSLDEVVPPPPIVKAPVVQAPPTSDGGKGAGTAGPGLTPEGPTSAPAPAVEAEKPKSVAATAPTAAARTAEKPRAATPAKEPEPPPPPAGKGKLSVSTVPWSQVFIDGRAVGRTPLVGLELDAGTHHVKLVTTAEFEATIEEDVEVGGGAEVRLIKRFAKPGG